MDGFAVRSEDVVDATASTPVQLAVVGEVAAGHEPGVRVAARHGGADPDGRDRARRR